MSDIDDEDFEQDNDEKEPYNEEDSHESF